MKNYADPKKLKARRDTLIRQYRRLFRRRLPDKKQYWTLAGGCWNSETQLLGGSELDQMSRTLLRRAGQFHGVDNDLQVIAGNKVAAPKAHWHHDDFYEALVKAINNGSFRPAIVNYDSLEMPKRGSLYLSKLMLLLAPFRNVMLVGNFILRRKFAAVKRSAIMANLASRPQFKQALALGWKFTGKTYVYHGTGKNTTMGSVVFFKR